jgi:hypothetical protein
MSLVQCPECFSKVSSNTGMCLACGFPASKSKASSVERDSNLNPLMIAYQSPIARENVFLPQPKPKPIVIKLDQESSDSLQGGLSCLQCGGGITPDDIKCSHCKTLIMRRYCAHCSKLIPDHAAICPLCNKDVKEHFLYSKLRRTKILIAVGTAAVFAFVVIMLILQQPESKTTEAQAAPVNKTEIPSPPAVAKSPAPEITHQKVESSPAPVVHEIVPPPTATKSIELPAEVPEIKQSEPEIPAEKVEESKIVKQIEVPKQVPKVEAPKQYADVTEEIPRRPALSSATVRALELRSRQKVLKGKSLNHKGYALIKKGRPAEAIPVLEESVRTFPPEGKHDLNYAYALFNLAVAYRMAGKPEMAIPLLRERIKINDQREIVQRELLTAQRQARMSENDFN